MATDQEIRDRGFKYVPQQKYLQNPFELPEDQEPVVDQGIVATNAFTGSGGFDPYNADMSQIRTDFRPDYDFRRYSEYGANPSTMDIKQMDMNQNYFNKPTPSGIQQAMLTAAGFIPGVGTAIKGAQFLGNALKGVMPVNQRAIMENQARGAGIFTDNIGRIVTDDYNTAGGIMAGYNLNKIDEATFDKRRSTIENTLGSKYNLSASQIEAAKNDPNYTGPGKDLIERLGLLDESEEDILGAKKKTTQIYKMRKDKKTKDDTTGTDTTDTTTYIPDGTPGGGAGQGIDISGAGTIRSSDNEFVGDSGPTTKQEQEYGYSTDFGFSDGGRVAFRGGGMDAGAGSDFGEENFGTTTTTTTTNNNNNNNNNDNNQVINNPVDISTVTKSVGDYEIPYGLEALIADKGKLQAVLNADNILNKNLGLDFTYDQGPYQVGFNADMEGNKNLGLSYNKGNLSAYANTDFNDPMFGVKYSRAFAYGGLASIL